MSDFTHTKPPALLRLGGRRISKRALRKITPLHHYTLFYQRWLPILYLHVGASVLMSDYLMSAESTDSEIHSCTIKLHRLQFYQRYVQILGFTLLTPVSKVAVQAGAVEGVGFRLGALPLVLTRRGRTLIHICQKQQQQHQNAVNHHNSLGANKNCYKTTEITTASHAIR